MSPLKNPKIDDTNRLEYYTY